MNPATQKRFEGCLKQLETYTKQSRQNPAHVVGLLRPLEAKDAQVILGEFFNQKNCPIGTAKQTLATTICGLTSSDWLDGSDVARLKELMGKEASSIPANNAASIKPAGPVPNPTTSGWLSIIRDSLGEPFRIQWDG